VGWALERFGIQVIFALPPQAKRRIERLFGTFQDLLITELQKASKFQIAKRPISS